MCVCVCWEVKVCGESYKKWLLVLSTVVVEKSVQLVHKRYCTGYVNQMLQYSVKYSCLCVIFLPMCNILAYV